MSWQSLSYSCLNVSAWWSASKGALSFRNGTPTLSLGLSRPAVPQSLVTGHRGPQHVSIGEEYVMVIEHDPASGWANQQFGSCFCGQQLQLKTQGLGRLNGQPVTGAYRSLSSAAHSQPGAVPSDSIPPSDLVIIKWLLPLLLLWFSRFSHLPRAVWLRGCRPGWTGPSHRGPVCQTLLSRCRSSQGTAGFPAHSLPPPGEWAHPSGESAAAPDLTFPSLQGTPSRRREPLRTVLLKTLGL